MGISASWISVEGLNRIEFLERLGVVETENRVSILDQWLPRRSEGGVTTLSNGRELFVSRDAYLATPEIAERVSEGAQLIMCSMEEHVMYSEAYSFTDGKLDWLIRHDRQRSDEEIVTEGIPPPSLEQALAKADGLDRRQGGADYHFDVPLDVATPIGGFNPDQDPWLFDGTLTLVERKGKGGLLKWLFGSF